MCSLVHSVKKSMFIHVLCVCKNSMHKGEIFPCQHVHLYLSLGTTGWTSMKLIRPLLIKTCITGFIKIGIIFFMWEYYEKKKYGNFML